MSTNPPDLNVSNPDPQIPSMVSAKASVKKRRLIVLLAVLAVPVGVVAYSKWNAALAASTTRSARAVLAADGIAVINTIADPDEKASLLHSWDSPIVVRIQSNGKPITDEELPKIAVISEDIDLVLSSCPVTNAGLSTFAGKNNVRCLDLAKTAFNDEGVKHLRGMNLQSLDLTGTRITDAGLATLGECDFPRLKVIAVEHTSVTDAGLMHLAKFKTLEWVSAKGTKLTTAGYWQLRAKLPDACILR